MNIVGGLQSNDLPGFARCRLYSLLVGGSFMTMILDMMIVCKITAILTMRILIANGKLAILNTIATVVTGPAISTVGWRQPAIDGDAVQAGSQPHQMHT